MTNIMPTNVEISIEPGIRELFLKYVPRLEGIMHSPSGRALCLLTLGHISAYNMDNTILLYSCSYGC